MCIVIAIIQTFKPLKKPFLILFSYDLIKVRSPQQLTRMSV